MAPPLRQYWSLLVHYLRPQAGRALLLAVLLLTHTALQLINPQIMRFFIDTALAGEALSILVQAAVLYLVVALVNQGLAIGNTYLSEQVAWTATNELRLDMLLHCLRLDLSFHKQYPAGELLERIDGDVTTLSTFFSRLTVGLIGNVILLIGILVLLFREDWRIGAALLLFTLIGLAIMVRIRSIAIPHWTALRQMNATFYGFLGEHLAATEDLQANGARPYVLHRLDELMRRWFPLRLRADLAGVALWPTTVGIFALGKAVALGLGAYLWLRDELTIGSVYLVFSYTELLRYPMGQIRQELTSFQQVEASIRRVRDLMGTETKVVGGSATTLPAGPLRVELDKVTFSYDERGTVLHDLSLTLEPGRVLGLLGRTGSGKTTLARLLLRLYDPSSGEIRLGGVPLPSLELDHLRQHVGLVTQDVQLFQASVRDNLTFFNHAIPDARILEVLDDLGLSTWLRALPGGRGLDTMLEAGAGGLSTGQAQLLAFARVFLSNPGLVILDEASASLDPATERLIEGAISKLLEHRTCIIIAHHLSTVQRADEILILQEGRILEHGERVALSTNPNSEFSRLLQTGFEEVLA